MRADADADADADAAKPVLSPLHFVERADESDPSAVRFSWPGTEIRTRFSGTGATLHLHDTGKNQFDVSIDGASPTRIATSSTITDYDLVSGLSDKEHDVVITKRTEASVGLVTLLGITSTENRPLVPTAAPAITRRIEFVGDSITCGYGVLGADQYCTFSADTENEQLAYGALTAAQLHAAHTAIAYSGIGVYRDFGGSTQDQMPDRYARVLADDASKQWDFRYVADVVVVNLGTNDFSKGDPGASFTTAYIAFLGQLRAKHPSARIVAALSPMLTDGYPAGEQHRSTARTYIQAAVSSRVSAGDTKVSFFEFDEQLESDGYGCDYHPSKITHQKMSNKLAADLKTSMGW
jgi:lysophospholipase L1-like esterase